MRLAYAFYKFPFKFDTERLLREVSAIPEESWAKHPGDYTGNSALPLISTNGAMNDSFEPPMRPTEFLALCPYVQQIMAQFQTLLGRARLMRLEPGHGVPPHIDMKYYWRTHARVHVPVITNPEIRFHCGTENVHMAAGEAWTFDNWRPHEVVNKTGTRRIHLTFDTLGSTAFWNLAKPLGNVTEPRFIPYENGLQPPLAYETYRGDPILSPSAVDMEFFRLISDVQAERKNDPAAVRNLQSVLGNFRNEWLIAWHSAGPTEQGLPLFVELIDRGRNAIRTLPESLKLASNGASVVQVLQSTFGAMIGAAALEEIKSKASARPRGNGASAAAVAAKFERPIFIVAAPRSGSTLLYEMLAENDALWTIDGESHGFIEQIEALNPRNRGWDSNRLVAGDAAPEFRDQIRANFLTRLCNADKLLYRDLPEAKPEAIRFLEKTPKNALRIPFFKALFPDAKFIFLHRESKANISSIIEAWRSGNFVTYRDLPGWQGLPWSLLLIPGWRELNGRDLAEIALRQWRDTNEAILMDLAALPADDWRPVSYEDVTSSPESVLQQLCAFAGIPFSARMRKIVEKPLRPSRYTLTAPNSEKWRDNESLIAPVIGEARQTIEKLNALKAGREHMREPAH